MENHVCHKCGNDLFIWEFTGWDDIYIDEDGAYHRRFKGEYNDTEVFCQKCQEPANHEFDPNEDDELMDIQKALEGENNRVERFKILENRAENIPLKLRVKNGYSLGMLKKYFNKLI